MVVLIQKEGGSKKRDARLGEALEQAAQVESTTPRGFKEKERCCIEQSGLVVWW